MKNLVIVSFPAKAETLETLKDAMRSALPDTRSYEGCLSVNTFIEESTNTIHLIEDWETLDHQATYLNWRVETGLLTDLDPLLDGGAAAIKVVLCGKEHEDI
tara:strand:- start:230 stop:535 length:306 start_codon:yes stop_codon:yes gene_type:complete